MSDMAGYAARAAVGGNGSCRDTRLVTAVMALYFNFFVLVVMAFRRLPASHELAPTESEQLFQQTQLVVLMIFVVFGIIAVRRFRLNSIAAA
jgi:hypothetical protein